MKSKTEQLLEKIRNMPQEEINKKNKLEVERVKKQYEEFIEKFKRGECYICNSPIKCFDERKVCLHWLLNPSGFKKRHFKKIYENFSYDQIDSYLRWVANTSMPLMNINDLKEEKSKNKVFEYTIKYKNIDWSFSCSNTDFKGHDTKFGKFPHYHLQIKIDGRIFIKYSDFHIPLTSWDIMVIKAKKGEFKEIGYFPFYGVGMGSIVQDNIVDLLHISKIADKKSKEAIRVQSFIEPKKRGETISGEEIIKVIKKSKETGALIANLFREKEGIKVKSIISPGRGVPEIAKRKGGRGSKKNRKI